MARYEKFEIEGVKYQIVTEGDAPDEVAYIEKLDPPGPRVPIAAFAAQPWRSWKEGADGIGAATVHHEVPASTAAIPLTLRKIVNAKGLNNIATLGLVIDPMFIAFYGYSAGTTYVNRDLAIKGVWMSTDGGAGESMKPSEGSWADLEIRVSRWFRDLFLRDLLAVLHERPAESGSTVISFMAIPKESLFLRVSPELLAAVQQADANSRLAAGALPLHRIGARDLETVAKLLPSLAPADDW